MMTHEEIYQDMMRRKAETKLVAAISKQLPSDLLSEALGIYLNNKWMSEKIFTREFSTEDDIEKCIDEILSMMN